MPQLRWQVCSVAPSPSCCRPSSSMTSTGILPEPTRSREGNSSATGLRGFPPEFSRPCWNIPKVLSAKPLGAYPLPTCSLVELVRPAPLN
jgi:hypothetical protein